MLQRIQTLFLLGVIICNVITIFVPIWTVSNIPDNFPSAFIITNTDTDAIPGTVSNFILLGLVIFSILLTLIIISQYKKRKLQLKLGILNMLVLIGYMILVVLKSNEIESSYLLFSPSSEISYSVGYFLPAVAIVLNLLASRYIKKDEELVRSMDRMR